MKTPILLATLVVGKCLLSAQPQIERGVYSASGSLSFSSTSDDRHVTITTFLLSPGIAFFLIDHVELSLNPSYSLSTSEVDIAPLPSTTTTSTVLGIQLGLRYYLASQTVLPFVGAGGGLSWSKVSGTLESPYLSPVKAYNIELGFDYLLTRTFSIEPSIHYKGRKTEYYSDRGFFVAIGVKYFVL